MSLPQVIRTLAELRTYRKNTQGILGVVPTMGALHLGHATLLNRLRRKCDVSVLTIFVNPTQFGPNEDLSRYPRTFEKDLQIAAAEGVDLVFAPTPEEIYPLGYSTYVEETSVSQPFCGVFRPGHFRGVTTIVLKLFHLLQPQLALFGLKDAQQFFVISKMVRDLNLDVRVIGVETVRQDNSLALSSRNVYLSEEARVLAPEFSKSLNSLKKALTLLPSQEVSHLISAEKARLNKLGFKVQYLDCAALPDLNLVENGTLKKELAYLIAGAAYLGNTRLIDNFILRPEQLLDFELIF